MSEQNCGSCSSGGDYLSKLHQVMRDKLIMSSAMVEVTHRCNMRCTHCYLPSWESPGEWTTQGLKDFLDQLAAEGVLYLTFTGGEFFLRHDCMEVLRYARDQRFSVGIITNAALIDRERARELGELAVTSLGVSIYGADEETYAAVTRTHGWYGKVAAALDHLKEAGVKVVMKLVITRDNVHQVEAMVAWAERLGFETQHNYEITPTDDGGLRPQDVAMTDEQLLDYLRRWGKRQPDRGIKDPESRTCNVGHVGLAYSPEGEVYPCVQMKRSIGSVKREKLREIWSQSPTLQRLRAMRFVEWGECASCEHSRYCSLCSGLAVVETGGDVLFGPNATSCRTAAARVAAGLIEGKDPRPLVEILRELPRYGEALSIY